MSKPVAAPTPPATTVMGRIDALLGRVTMYRLVLIVLAVLAAYTIILAAFDVLFYAPLGMLACLAVAVVSTLAGTYLGAVVVKAEPHVESSLITALLIFFLFWPASEWANLKAVGLAGVFAGLSKFVIAWRGRHVANPAAVGAVVVTIIGQGATVWWVAGEAMLPVIVLGGLLVLYRTRRVGSVAWFVIPAYLMTVKAVTDFGSTVPDALWSVLTSYPILFLGVFMLSEPLTQPALRRQRAVVGIVVALLYVSQLYYPSWYASWPTHMTPELSLVIGNVIAFAFGQRRGLPLRVVDRRELGGDLHEWTFHAPNPLRVRAGQFLELAVPHRRADGRGNRRVFSVVSSSDDGSVRIATRIPENSSSYKRALVALAPGDTVRANSVAGDFLTPRSGTKVALVAGGVGVTPFVSHVKELTGRTGCDVRVVYAWPGGSAPAYLDELTAVPGVVVSPERPEGLPEHWQWVRSSVVSQEVLAQAVPDLAARTVYVSGSPAMVAAVRRSARAIGAKRIRTDAFTGY